MFVLWRPTRTQTSRRRAIRGLLHVSGDGLRVVDDDTKGLIVDQTIEKVSFCAPDRNHERGFSYICRDGTTRRWMCHGFLAHKDSGERLSHAVGCAFAVCLERKQRRDTECGVTMTFDMKNSTFTRSGSFRTHTITERLNSNERGIDLAAGPPSALVTPQPKPHNPFAIERPHATPSMMERLERQGSFRAVGTQSPFKRQMSLRINDLPSNAERQRAYLDPSSLLKNGHQQLPPRTISPIPESVPHKPVDTVAQLCAELSQGLSLLTRTTTDDDLNFNNSMSINQNKLNGSSYNNATMYSGNSNQVMSVFPMPSSAVTATAIPPPISLPLANVSSTTNTPTAQVQPYRNDYSPLTTPTSADLKMPGTPTTSPAAATTPSSSSQLPKAEQWLGQVVKSNSPSPRRARAKSLTTTTMDPFDAEWVAGITQQNPTETQPQQQHNTNPFISPPKPPAQSFQVQL